MTTVLKKESTEIIIQVPASDQNGTRIVIKGSFVKGAIWGNGIHLSQKNEGIFVNNIKFLRALNKGLQDFLSKYDEIFGDSPN